MAVVYLFYLGIVQRLGLRRLGRVNSTLRAINWIGLIGATKILAKQLWEGFTQNEKKWLVKLAQLTQPSQASQVLELEKFH